MEEVQQYLGGAKFFIKIDFKDGYTQISLHESCRELFSFATHNKVLTLKRMPQGCNDSVMWFTYLIFKIFEARVYKGLIVWLDDLLLYAKSIDELFSLLEWVLAKAAAHNLKFSIKKCDFFAQEISWCGKLITPAGIKVDPTKIDALQRIEIPNSAAELMQFLCAAGWLRTALPQFAQASATLQEWLQSLLADGKRTKRRALNINLQWTKDLKKSFQKVKDLIGNAVMQSHPNDDAEMVLFTDASDNYWGAMLGQVLQYDRSTSIEKQQIKPLYFLSGSFKGSQLRWATVDKESFAIVEAVERLRHLVVRKNGFRIFTDHVNLQYIFCPHDSVKLPARSRLARWALRLQEYNYSIEHIAGELNVWADLLSRWGAGPKQVVANAARVQYDRRVANALSWPTLDEIQELQKDLDEAPTDGCEEQNGLLMFKGRVWIPPLDYIRSALMVIAHYGFSGHASIANTMENLKAFCQWETLETDVRDFVKECVLCRTGKMPTPTRVHHGRHIRPEAPRLMICFDYVYIRDSTEGFKYLLVIRDEFSRLVKLYLARSCDTEPVVHAILDWIATNGMPARFKSDNGTHFRNTVMKSLMKRLKREHTFSTAYCAWSNGRVERVIQDVVVLFPILHSEAGLNHEDWPMIRVNVESALNHRRSSVLGNHAPITIHMGAPPSDPLSVVFHDSTEKFHSITWTPDILAHVDKLMESIAGKNNDVRAATARRDSQARKSTEGQKLSEFEIGDYVLYAYVERPAAAGKLFCTWLGPVQIVDTKSDYVMIVRDLASGRLLDAHVTRLSFYSTSEMNVTTELVEHISRQGLPMTIDSVIKLIYDEDRCIWLFEVKWSGFSSLENSFEPFDSFFNQVPLLVLDFLIDFSQEESSVFQLFWKKHQKQVVALCKKRKYNTEKYLFISKRR